MSNGLANCALAVCCPPRSDEQKSAFQQEYVHSRLKACETFDERRQCENDLNARRAAWEEALNWVVDNYDLAPAGTLQPFKDEIARLALSDRPPPHKQTGLS